MNNEHSGSNKRYYITTAIDYPNAPPHIGHSLEKVAADVIARFHRLQGYDTYFSIGVDENSQHVARAAEANGSDPTTWVNNLDSIFRLAWSRLDISNDYWIRTTEERHVRASQELFLRAQARGDIYKSIYSGWYCPNDNTFYTSEELVDGRCPNHPSIVPEWLEEENYFFALTKYSDRLLAHITEHPEFIVPANRRAEVLAMIQQGLRDFSVSRLLRTDTKAWGVPVPGDPKHTMYVCVDAVRYSLLRGLSFASDGDFSRASLVRHYNDDLANDLGNLLNRVVTMTLRYRDGINPTPGPAGSLEEDLQRIAEETRHRAAAALNAWEIGGALSIIWNFVRRTNQYIEQSEPWRLARQAGQEERLNTVLYSAAEALRLLAIFLAPYIPSAADNIFKQLGLEAVAGGAWVEAGTWGSRPLAHVVAGPLLFPRIMA